MSKFKWNFIAIISLLTILLNTPSIYAAEDFFWSDSKPMPSCTTSTDKKPSKRGIIKDGKRIEIDLPSCEEAKKNLVLVKVNDKYLQTYFGSGAEPFIDKGSTMIPLRAIADAFGFEVQWDKKEEKITLTKDSMTILMYIGKSEMQVDGKAVNLEAAVPMIKNNVTFLPVRELAEILDIKVEWDKSTRTATFSE